MGVLAILGSQCRVLAPLPASLHLELCLVTLKAMALLVRPSPEGKIITFQQKCLQWLFKEGLCSLFLHGLEAHSTGAMIYSGPETLPPAATLMEKALSTCNPQPPKPLPSQASSFSLCFLPGALLGSPRVLCLPQSALSEARLLCGS